MKKKAVLLLFSLAVLFIVYCLKLEIDVWKVVASNAKNLNDMLSNQLHNTTSTSHHVLEAISRPEGFLNVQSENETTKVQGQRAVIESLRQEVKSCQRAVSKFVYIKTHKTGSTSIRIMLRNFLIKNDLWHLATAVCPKPYVGGYPGSFSCKFKFPSNATISISHTRFDAEEMRRCFDPKTKYLTILRDPWHNFQSAFNFYKKSTMKKPHCSGMPAKYVIGGGQSIDVHQFLMDADRLLNESVPWFFRFRNSQSHDLGIDPTSSDDRLIEDSIKKLDKNMHLVMLLEYLDESLILLKDLLCMDWDVLQNFYQWYGRTYDKVDGFLTEGHKQTFEKLNKIDIKLYDHFNKTFWRRVEAYGRPRMAEDLKTLRAGMTTHKQERFERYDIKMYSECETHLPSIERYMEHNSGACSMPTHS